MAKSGSIDVNVTNSGTIKLNLSWNTGEPDISNNKDTISYELSLITTSASISSAAQKQCSIEFDGQVVYNGYTTIGIGQNQTKVLCSGNFDMFHNSDGTKNFNYSFSQQINATINGTNIGTITGNGSGELDTIPRGTKPTLSNDNVELGDVIIITTTGTSADFVHKLYYKVGNGNNVLISNNVIASYPFVVTTNIANSFPNTISGIVVIICETYRDGILIGTNTTNLIINIPTSSAFNPMISNVIVVDDDTTISDKFNAYVQGKSQLNISFDSLGVYSSTIVSNSIIINNQIFVDKTALTNLLVDSGNQNVVMNTTDSRGRLTQLTQEIEVIPYQYPLISLFDVNRCNADGTINDDGDCVNVVAQASISDVNNMNDKLFILRYRDSQDNAWIQQDVTPADGYVLNISNLVIADIDVDYTYEFQLLVTDFFGTIFSFIVPIGTSGDLIDFNASGNAIAFGKASEIDNVVEFASKLRVILPSGNEAIGCEKGNNEKGDYIKFDDGTLYQYGRVSLGVQTFTDDYWSTFNVSGNQNMSIEFPIPFLANTVPACKLTPEVGVGMDRIKPVATPTNSQPFLIITPKSFTANQEVFCSYQAIGKWK